MKTKVNAIARPMVDSLDELIFKNRNRDYGAYELRKKYKKRLFIGFIFGSFVFATGISVPMIQAYLIPKAHVDNLKDEGARILENPDIDHPKPPTPPPPPIDTKVARYNIPQVVDTTIDENELLTTDDLIKSISNDTNMITVAVIGPVNGGIFDEPEPPQIIVDEPAMFEGGDLNTFRNWVQSNVIYPASAIEAGVQGTVYLSFVINLKGHLTDIKIQRGVHPSINDETIRVLNSSPEWKPAKLNGRVVRQIYNMPVKFELK
jgi:periplasmic protein TonB